MLDLRSAGVICQWRVTDEGGELVDESAGDIAFRFWPASTGTFNIEVTVLLEDAKIASVEEQRTTVESNDEFRGHSNPFVRPNTLLAFSTRGPAWELINDFRSMIHDAADMTGPCGIPASFLAAVLSIELEGRPKSVREPEIHHVMKLLYRELDDTEDWPWQTVDRSIGPGQLRLSNIAMRRGMIPWIEQDRRDRRPARRQIKENFESLPAQTKLQIMQSLRWPRSGILETAKMLVHLKNRSQRYGALTREEFAGNERAVSIIATEYNLGASTTLEQQAAPNGYGRKAWRIMENEPFIDKYFR